MRRGPPRAAPAAAPPIEAPRADTAVAPSPARPGKTASAAAAGRRARFGRPAAGRPTAAARLAAVAEAPEAAPAPCPPVLSSNKVGSSRPPRRAGAASSSAAAAAAASAPSGGILAVSLHSAAARDSEAAALTHWLNGWLSPGAPSPDAAAAAAPSAPPDVHAALATARAAARTRRAAFSLLHSPALAGVRAALDEEVAAGRLALAPDAAPHADPSLRARIASLLIGAYDPAWLRLGLETVLGVTLGAPPADDAAIQGGPQKASQAAAAAASVAAAPTRSGPGAARAHSAPPAAAAPTASSRGRAVSRPARPAGSGAASRSRGGPPSAADLRRYKALAARRERSLAAAQAERRAARATVEAATAAPAPAASARPAGAASGAAPHLLSPADLAAALRRCITSHLCVDDDAAARFARLGPGAALRRGAAASLEQQRSVLQRTLVLVLFLDWAKAAHVLQLPPPAPLAGAFDAAAAAAASTAGDGSVSSPSLFRPTSALKTSRAVLAALTAPTMLPLRGEGDVLRHLATLGYALDRAPPQTPLDEAAWGVRSLAADLRDGARLVRLAEALSGAPPLSVCRAGGVRMPAPSRTNKLHNAALGLRELSVRLGFSLDGPPPPLPPLSGAPLADKSSAAGSTARRASPAAVVRGRVRARRPSRASSTSSRGSSGSESRGGGAASNSSFATCRSSASAVAPPRPPIPVQARPGSAASSGASSRSPSPRALPPPLPPIVSVLAPREPGAHVPGALSADPTRASSAPAPPRKSFIGRRSVFSARPPRPRSTAAAATATRPAPAAPTMPAPVAAAAAAPPPSVAAAATTSVPVHARDIVDGHRERTVALLWAAVGAAGLRALVPEPQVRAVTVGVAVPWTRLIVSCAPPPAQALTAEIARATPPHTPAPASAAVPSPAAPLPSLLLSWVASVAGQHGLRGLVQAWEGPRSGLADGRALCTLVAHYRPDLIARGDVGTRTVTPLLLPQQPASFDEHAGGRVQGGAAVLRLRPTVSQAAVAAALAVERTNFAALSRACAALGLQPAIPRASGEG